MSAVAAPDQAANELARDIFRQLIEINTTESAGNVTAASEAMARRLLDAGFAPADVQILGADPRKKNLVARLRGNGKRRPVLLLGHLDVVEARREDWSTDPFELVEQDGYFYGRGTLDMKGHDAILVTTLIRFKKEGFVPDRDLILALTADEEGGNANGVDWLLRNHRELIDADFVLNQDEASVTFENGRLLFYNLVASEKIYADFVLTTTNRGGHSSLPEPDNAIYQLMAGLAHLARYEFPVELNDVTRAYYERIATLETPERAADMRAILQVPPDATAAARLSRNTSDHARLHTTCIATRLDAGHANNALPHRAQAVVNCRILPGHTPEEVRQTLIAVVADPGIKVQYVGDNDELLDTASAERGFPPPALRPEMLRPLEKVVAKLWPNLPVVPTMSMGATDAVYTNAAGLPTYVATGIEIDRSQDRSHGRDERVGVESFYRGVEFCYRYLKAVATQ
ncbi:MAG TPA: M20/M25/M40 family metallo-hydrolase [Steroidobacteraceae bacterium]|nr:M20/M25/M40 family metallo-hydrolase [Steroidobacteraceae bacterium]